MLDALAPLVEHLRPGSKASCDAMGKAPRECGVRPIRVSQVTFHPRADVLALGYEDGFVTMVRFKNNSEILIRREDNANGTVSD